MGVNEKKLEDLKLKLYRLHFLLTEKQNDETRQNGINQFIECSKSAYENLADYLNSEYSVKVKSPKDVVEKSFQKNLFNETTMLELEEMNKALEQAETNENISEIFSDVQENYSRLLQMIYDMLKRMGEEPHEDDND